MMKKFFGMLCLAVLFAATGEARGAVITFDTGDKSQQVASWQTDYDLTGAVDVQFNSNYYKWDIQFQNLVNVAFGPDNSPLLIDFVAEGGNSVTLNSFDLGAYNGSAPYIARYKIYDLLNSTLLYDSSDFSIDPNTTPAPTFNVNLSSLTGLRIELRELGQLIAIDNISYSAAAAAAVVPEPVTMVTWGIGVCGMGLVARRKKKQTV